MALDSLQDLYVDELKDLLHAEKQILRALPKMAKKASAEELRMAFEEHLEQTRGHVQRLEQIFEDLGMAARAKPCRGMEGLIEEGSELMKEEAEPDVMDAGLIAAAQRVEHYEMAAYGSLRAYAETLGYEEAANLLQTTLDEEGAADKKLTQIAESSINMQAREAEDESAEDEQPKKSASRTQKRSKSTRSR